jgi:transposase, IS30 family
LWKHLARHKAKRGLRKYRGSGISRIPGRISIHARPAREGFGHWEGDLMSFRKNSQHMLVTLEKKTRFVMAKPLLNKTAKVTARAGFLLFKRLSSQARQSMTLDNGGEFAKHTQWREKLGLATYFCDPYCSWQKGAVENANGFLRRDLPRKTDLKALQSEEFNEIIFNHNTKPRKCLGWKTPLEAFTENLNLVALQT